MLVSVGVGVCDFVQTCFTATELNREALGTSTSLLLPDSPLQTHKDKIIHAHTHADKDIPLSY